MQNEERINGLENQVNEDRLELLVNEGHPKEKYLFQCDRIKCDDYGVAYRQIVLSRILL